MTGTLTPPAKRDYAEAAGTAVGQPGWRDTVERYGPYVTARLAYERARNAALNTPEALAERAAARERTARWEAEADQREAANRTEALALLREWMARPSARTAARIEAAAPPSWYLAADIRRLTARVQIDVLAQWASKRARRRWSLEHRSQSDYRGRTGYSRYLARHAGRAKTIRLRLSDHDLPQTDERQYNNSQGWSCCNRELILTGTETWREALRMLAEEI